MRQPPHKNSVKNGIGIGLRTVKCKFHGLCDSVGGVLLEFIKLLGLYAVLFKNLAQSLDRILFLPFLNLFAGAVGVGSRSNGRRYDRFCTR